MLCCSMPDLEHRSVILLVRFCTSCFDAGCVEKAEMQPCRVHATAK